MPIYIVRGVRTLLELADVPLSKMLDGWWTGWYTNGDLFPLNFSLRGAGNGKEEKHATKWILYKILISDKIPLSNKMMWFGQKNNFWIKWKKINKFFIINIYNHELVQRLLDGLRLNGNVWGPKVDLLQRPLNLLSPLWSAFELALTPLAHFGQAWNVILQLPAFSSSKFCS